MILSIDTTDSKQMSIGLKKEDGRDLALKNIKTEYNQAEKLLPSVIKALESKKIELKKIRKIVIANKGGSFTSLRIGVVTANALGYALGIPVEGKKQEGLDGKGELLTDFDVVEPLYDREPNITIKKP